MSVVDVEEFSSRNLEQPGATVRLTRRQHPVVRGERDSCHSMVGKAQHLLTGGEIPNRQGSAAAAGGAPANPAAVKKGVLH